MGIVSSSMKNGEFDEVHILIPFVEQKLAISLYYSNEAKPWVFATSSR